MKFKPGDMVRFVDPKADGSNREPYINLYYPEVGGVGHIIEIVNDENARVKWDDLNEPYYVALACIELVNAETENKGREWEDANILAFLNGKFAKNPNMTFNEMMVLAYRSGYLRAKKGRPMVKGMDTPSNNVGHWEPVDPNNLPKVGSKVRYAREIDWWDGFPKHPEGQTGIVTENNKFAFGITWDDHSVIEGRYKTVYSFEHPDRFDVWVDTK